MRKVGAWPQGAEPDQAAVEAGYRAGAAGEAIGRDAGAAAGREGCPIRR